jgi:hypothetical protein
MDAALHDPAKFPEPDQFNIYRPVNTTPWGMGEFGCPAFQSSWELLVIVGEEFSSRYGAYPWRPYIARAPVFFNALLPSVKELLIGCRKRGGILLCRDDSRVAALSYAATRDQTPRFAGTWITSMPS